MLSYSSKDICFVTTSKRLRTSIISSLYSIDFWLSLYYLFRWKVSTKASSSVLSTYLTSLQLSSVHLNTGSVNPPEVVKKLGGENRYNDRFYIVLHRFWSFLSSFVVVAYILCQKEITKTFPTIRLCQIRLEIRLCQIRLEIRLCQILTLKENLDYK